MSPASCIAVGLGRRRGPPRASRPAAHRRRTHGRLAQLRPGSVDRDVDVPSRRPRRHPRSSSAANARVAGSVDSLVVDRRHRDPRRPPPPGSLVGRERHGRPPGRLDRHRRRPDLRAAPSTGRPTRSSGARSRAVDTDRGRLRRAAHPAVPRAARRLRGRGRSPSRSSSPPSAPARSARPSRLISDEPGHGPRRRASSGIGRAADPRHPRDGHDRRRPARPRRPVPGPAGARVPRLDRGRHLDRRLDPRPDASGRPERRAGPTPRPWWACWSSRFVGHPAVRQRDRDAVRVRRAARDRAGGSSARPRRRIGRRGPEPARSPARRYGRTG